MGESKPLLLLTASIDPKVSNTPMTFITDPEIRLSQYRSTLQKMIHSRSFGKIVFCENTNYAVDFADEKKLANNCDVELELIRFKGSHEKIKKQGKGYGEGEIIEYAIQNSTLMSKEHYFFKLTGRVQIKNIKKLLSHTDKKQLFIKYNAAEDKVDTRFFGCSIAFYKKHLLEAYKEVNDLEGNYLEIAFFRKLKPLKRNLSVFGYYPKYLGLAGSTGQSYRMGVLKYFWYQFQLSRGGLSI